MTDQIPDTGFGSWQAWAERAQREGGTSFRIDGVYQPNSQWHRMHQQEIELRATVLSQGANSLARITKGEANRSDIIEEVT